ncbi:CoA transferase [Nonomuraea africana]|uniref:Crotonobetainyl-CoA:carnitine CoA-transferase CaiB-like acyl-CoA transferase n=1 Tax=Nonomuraea africana TaxID=46171 RepID=A0ABR9KWN5_9ACTN|nr:CoA transferase [Nonomuraea africana]MBE1566410.1 crotonobetainyl-CoA:carnitine CoA-transferase CaiB-like acyl-CoA transferase [Nonomuraea africana]
MIAALIHELGMSAGVTLPEVRVTDDGSRLPSVYQVEVAAAVSVGAATAAAAAMLGTDAAVDVREALAAFRDERYFRIDGEPGELWAELSGDYRTADGWVRLHCNFDHHRVAALRALGLSRGADREAVRRACESRTALEIERRVTQENGCAAALRTQGEWRADPRARAVARTPLVEVTRLPASPGGSGDGQPFAEGVSHPGERAGGGDGLGLGGARVEAGASRRGEGSRGSSPGGWEVKGALEGVRVLDLTRVIAGPVATRTMAAYGADVLKVGAPDVPEVPGLVISTAFGKRSCHLDLRSDGGRRALAELVEGADVVVRAVRPGALRVVDELVDCTPGLVSVEITAYGPAGGRGFDSLVQMATGIAWGDPPRPLPAQVLDHATGYLAAFGAIAALLRRRVEGGSWRVRLSLARTAQWLDELGKGEPVDRFDIAGSLGEMDSGFGRLTYVLPPGRIGGRRPEWTSPPPPQGADFPTWRPRD